MSTSTGPESRSRHDPPPASKEQVQEYLEQLRRAPADQIVTEVLFSVLNAAQAKLGRRDARLLIDLSAVIVEHVRDHVPADLVEQVERTLGQLRLGQVSAENTASEGEPEPGDLDREPRAPAGSARPPSAPTSTLWVPGR